MVENGYDCVVDELYKHKMIEAYVDYIVLIETSYDGIKWDKNIEFLSGEDYSFEWNNDWWEGQKYIKVKYCIPLTRLLELDIPKKYWVDENIEIKDSKN